MESHRLIQLFEQYTMKCPSEVLLITAKIDGEEDQIIIFRGFSSSIVRSTAFDPDTPILTDQAEIISIDRLKAPYTPDNPVYIESNLSGNSIDAILGKVGMVGGVEKIPPSKDT